MVKYVDFYWSSKIQILQLFGQITGKLKGLHFFEVKNDMEIYAFGTIQRKELLQRKPYVIKDLWLHT